MHPVICKFNFISWFAIFKCQQLRNVSRAKGARRAGLSANVQKDVSRRKSTEICHQVRLNFIHLVCIIDCEFIFDLRLRRLQGCDTVISQRVCGQVHLNCIHSVYRSVFVFNFKFMFEKKAPEL